MRMANNPIAKLVYRNFILALALFTSVACSGQFREAVGLKRSQPDEFSVVANAPLVVPPEFNLRPPVPGAKRPHEIDLQQQAKDALFATPEQQNTKFNSKAESAFLQKAQVNDSNPQIKEELIQDEQEAQVVKKKKGFFEKMGSYLNPGKNKEPVVNASKEKERLEENKKSGKPVNEGGVAVKEDSKGGLLNSVFGF